MITIMIKEKLNLKAFQLKMKSGKKKLSQVIS